MTRYVLGFLFTPDEERVVLLEKTHGPSNMAGQLNGVGGKIEPGESALQAMHREALEEVGVRVAWDWFGSMEGPGWKCDLFRAHDEQADEAIGNEDEKVWFVDPDDLPAHAMPNLPWLIGLARDSEAHARVTYGPASARSSR